MIPSTSMRAAPTLATFLLAVSTIASFSPRAEALDDFAPEFNAACDALVRRANAGPYIQLIERTDYKRDPDIARLFAPSSEAIARTDALSYWHVDIDADGVADHVAISMSGTMAVNQAFVVLGEREAASRLQLGGIDQAQGPDIGLTVSLVRLDDRYYFVSPKGSFWTLWAVREGRFVKACMLDENDAGVSTLKSTNDALCEKANDQTLQYLDYPEQHSLTHFPNEDRFWSRSPGSGMAIVDIDNDGVADNVARIDFSSGAGRGCDRTYVAVLNESRTAVPATPINTALEQIEGHCGPEMKLFVHDTKVYLDMSGEGGRSVTKFEGGRREEICQFKSVTKFERLR